MRYLGYVCKQKKHDWNKRLKKADRKKLFFIEVWKFDLEMTSAFFQKHK